MCPCRRAAAMAKNLAQLAGPWRCLGLAAR